MSLAVDTAPAFVPMTVHSAASCLHCGATVHAECLSLVHWLSEVLRRQCTRAQHSECYAVGQRTDSESLHCLLLLLLALLLPLLLICRKYSIDADAMPWDNDGDTAAMLTNLRGHSYQALVLDSPVVQYFAAQAEACDLFPVGRCDDSVKNSYRGLG
jgi:hypothetical protein